MGLVAKNSGGGDFTPAPAGNHIGRCVQLIDLGTQYSEFYGNSAHKMLVGWELPNEANEKGEPFLVWKRYTISLHENARLRADLESWRGRKFTKEELEGFDLRKLLGVPAMVNVSHNESNGKTYANVDAVAPLPKGMECPEQVHKTVRFDLDAPDMDVYAGFSDGLKATIAASDEWKASATQGQSQPQTQEGGESDEDVPF